MLSKQSPVVATMVTVDDIRIAVIGTGHTATGGSTPPASIAAVVGDGFHAELVETESQVFPGDREARLQVVEGYIAAGESAAGQGFDGIFINTVGDYGLAQLRARLTIPVIGAGEASMLLARALTGRFSIVTIWPPELDFIYRQLLHDYDMGDFCTGVRYASAENALDALADDDNFVEQMRRGEVSSMDNLIGHCRRAAQDDGAEVVLLGCTCMSPAAPLIAVGSPVPVIDPLTTGYRMTELALRQVNQGRAAEH